VDPAPCAVCHFRAQAAKGEPQEPTPPAERAAIPVISHDPLYNLILLEKNGFDTPMLRDRLPITLLLRNGDSSLRSE